MNTKPNCSAPRAGTPRPSSSFSGSLPPTTARTCSKRLGNCMRLTSEPDAARYWRERRYAGYLQSAQRGEVHYYHHLADYYSDVAKDGTEAVSWARADLQLRENFSTQAALAWAHYRNARARRSARLDRSGARVRRRRCTPVLPRCEDYTQGASGQHYLETREEVSIRSSNASTSIIEAPHEARITSAAFSATM